MTAIGIVAEYNPFHLGHAWHIAQTHRLLGGPAGGVRHERPLGPGGGLRHHR